MLEFWLGSVLWQGHVRVSKRTLDHLRRAAVERRIRGDRPFTQQAIVEEALREWLRAREGEGEPPRR